MPIGMSSADETDLHINKHRGHQIVELLLIQFQKFDVATPNFCGEFLSQSNLKYTSFKNSVSIPKI